MCFISPSAFEISITKNGDIYDLGVYIADVSSYVKPGSLIDGTQIVVYATVKVNRLTANGKANIKLRYTNEASIRKSDKV